MGARNETGTPIKKHFKYSREKKILARAMKVTMEMISGQIKIFRGQSTGAW